MTELNGIHFHNHSCSLFVQQRRCYSYYIQKSMRNHVVKSQGIFAAVAINMITDKASFLGACDLLSLRIFTICRQILLWCFTIWCMAYMLYMVYGFHASNTYLCARSFGRCYKRDEIVDHELKKRKEKKSWRIKRTYITHYTISRWLSTYFQICFLIYIQIYKDKVILPHVFLRSYSISFVNVTFSNVYLHQ